MKEYVTLMLYSIIWGIIPTFDKSVINGVNINSFYFWKTIILAIFVPFAVLTFTNDIHIDQAQNLFTDWRFIVSAILSVVGNFLYYYIMKNNDVSYLAYIIPLTIVFTLLSAMLFLKEQLTMDKIIGIILILSGIYIVYRNGTR